MMKLSIFITFLICGFIAASINWTARLLLNDFFYINLIFSIAIAHILGMIVAFILFKKIVFNSKKNISASLLSFVFVNVLSLVIIYIMTILFIYIFSLFNSDVLFIKGASHGLAICITSISSFILHKKFTY